MGNAYFEIKLNLIKPILSGKSRCKLLKSIIFLTMFSENNRKPVFSESKS